MDRVLEQRAATGFGPIRSPARVPGDDPARRPELVVAQRVRHRRARLAGLDHLPQSPDQRVEA